MEFSTIENGSVVLPLILQTTASGEPVGWINYEKCAYFYAKDRILWSIGQHTVKLRGGINAVTGRQSVLTMDTIVAVDTGVSPTKWRKGVPPLTSKALFLRDKNLCAYCGNQFTKNQLTKDHIVPRSKGGKNTWTNLVTCCKKCNGKKGDKTLEESNLSLLYVPYVPNYNEHLILQNRTILADQMEYLIKGVGKDSRIHDMIAEGHFNL